MDRHVGDHQQVLVHVDQLLLDIVPLLHHHLTRHGQGTVQPGGAQHAAVPLRVEAHVGFGALQLRVFLDPEGGGVGVAGGDHEAPGLSRRDPEGDQRRPAPDGVILPAGDGAPAPPLRKRRIARPLQLPAEAVHRVEPAGALVQKMKKIVHQKVLLIRMSRQ